MFVLREDVVMKRSLAAFFFALTLAGCAVNTRYVSYTDQKFPAKSTYYFISIYPETQAPSFTQPYRTIGRVEVSGHASDGVNADTLGDEARQVARSRGADAIINARTEAVNYSGMEVIPGYCGYRRCRPPEYIPYIDTDVRLRGELIVFMPAGVTESK